MVPDRIKVAFDTLRKGLEAPVYGSTTEFHHDLSARRPLDIQDGTYRKQYQRPDAYCQDQGYSQRRHGLPLS